MALYTMIGLGIGEILGGTFVGKIRDKSGYHFALLIELILLSGGLALNIIVNERNVYDWTAPALTFVYGLQDGDLNTFINCILGFEFESKITPFCVYKMV